MKNKETILEKLSTEFISSFDYIRKKDCKIINIPLSDWLLKTVSEWDAEIKDTYPYYTIDMIDRYTLLAEGKIRLCLVRWYWEHIVTKEVFFDKFPDEL